MAWNADTAPVEPPRCVECNRQPRADENARDDWRCHRYGLAELLAFYPECVEREFGAWPNRKTND